MSERLALAAQHNSIRASNRPIPSDVVGISRSAASPPTEADARAAYDAAPLTPLTGLAWEDIAEAERNAWRGHVGAQKVPWPDAPDATTWAPPRLAWFVAYTAFRQEFRVVQALAEQRIDAYCPAATVWRVHARKREAVPAPLLPRYVFAQLDAERPRFDLVKGIDGVECLVGDKLRPSRLTGADVQALERIRADEAAGMFDETSASLIAAAAAAMRAKRRLRSFAEMGEALERS